MGQEFHVLRCFSCETFQVQQVKKSRKWSCKMCGEKQSLIKEYGRGTGADCRRHAQKLNSLRGELLEAETESTLAQWDKEEKCEIEDRSNEAQSYESQQDEVSRWSKYVDQKDNESTGDEEGENIYTERQRFKSHDKLRKRKKSFTVRNACGPNTGYEDKDTDNMRWQRKGRSLEMHQRGDFFKLSAVEHPSEVSPLTSTCPKTPTSSSICSSPAKSTSSKCISTNAIGANKQPSIELNGNHQLAESTFALDQLSSESKLEAEGSRWARFLTCDSVEEENVEDDNYDWRTNGGTTTSGACLSFLPVPPVTKYNKESNCTQAQLDVCQGCKTTRTEFDKLSQCVPRITSKNLTFSLMPVYSQSPVYPQAPPVKRLCTSLSTFFHTDEDFDDTI